MRAHRSAPGSLVIISGLLILPGAFTPSGAASLTFEDRVEAQRALDEVRYSHQIGANRPFDEAVPSKSVRDRVQAYLERTVALERSWNKRITAEMLTREVDRMVRHSRLPDRLYELFEALDHDPLLIRECLARPALVDRLTRSYFDKDRRIHAAELLQAEAIGDGLAAGRIDPFAEHPLRSVVTLVREGTPDASLQQPLQFVLPTAEFERIRARLTAAGPVSLEDETGTFVVRSLLRDHNGKLTIARYEVPKKSWDNWWAETRPGLDPGSVVVPAGSDLPLNVDTKDTFVMCEPDDTWLPGSMNAPQGVWDHTAVWTGDRMIVWGGSVPSVGYLYDPATDTWTPVGAEGSPAGRYEHTAVWTGEEMIVWGGRDDGLSIDTGGRYNPMTDTWVSTSTVNAPDRRHNHTAVWTGTEMIVWGGRFDADVGCASLPAAECIMSNCCVANGTPGCTDPVCEQIICDVDPYCCDVLWDQICADAASADPTCAASCGNAGPIHYFSGGRYDPVTDTWTPTSTAGNPPARHRHTAVWTGSEMIVWGGFADAITLVTGGRYDPVANAWTPTSTVQHPSSRATHTAVWTGSEMIVWGGWADGDPLDTGSRYDPVADAWTPTSPAGCPAPRSRHTAVWTGNEMIVWGGSDLETGGHYDPATDQWTPTAMDNAPEARTRHTAVWTGDEMIVWGGQGKDTGGCYDPVARSWTPTATGGGPSPRYRHAAVWTGTEMIVWGGYGGQGTGGRYDPASDSWAQMSTAGAPERGSAVWTGNRMVVWRDDVGGGRYDPWHDSWTPVSLTNAPPTVKDFSVVWTGDEMIVWGGYDAGGDLSDTGGRYDPDTDSWTPTSTSNAPEARRYHSAVWTGDEMIVWGGQCCGWPIVELNTGGRYDPLGNSWTPTGMVNVPEERERHTAVWTGAEMIVWGGSDLDTGGHYDPATDQWTPTAMESPPEGREDHTAVWTGSRMIVWGGMASAGVPSGGVYTPESGSWTHTSLYHAPERRREHSAVWSGGLMIIWGGWTYGTGSLDNGGIYAHGHEVDDDGDGLSECDGDCDDSRYECSTDCRDLDGDTYCGDADCDDSRPECALDCSDADADGSCADADCAPLDPYTYPGAVEVNDGVDNQCPGDLGYGVTDETSGVSGFFDPLDCNVYSWPAQQGAILYAVARASHPDFSVDCTQVITGDTFWIDVALPLSGECFFYLNRPLAPHLGSWGQDSSGVERTDVCSP